MTTFPIHLALVLFPTVAPQRAVVPPASEVAPAREAVETIAVAFDFRLRVTDESEALEGVPLDVGLCGESTEHTRYEDALVLARVLTDSEGRVRGELEVPVELGRGEDVRVFARIAAPGYQRRVARRDPRTRRGATRIRLVAGETLFGTVLNRDGEPAPARVRWKGASMRGSRGTTADARGRFALDYAESGTYSICARNEDGSNVYLDELGLSSDERPPEVTLRLVDGGEELAGRLVDPLGEPIAGMFLVAVPAGRETFPEVEEAFVAERAGGRLGGRARADEAGRFEFPRLVSGEFDVYATWSSSGSRSAKPVDEYGPRVARLPTGEGEVELVRAEHRVEVRILDSTGEAFVVPDSNPWESPLTLSPAEAGSVLTNAWWMGPEGVSVGTATVFPTEPGAEYVAAWQRCGFPYQEHPVFAAPARYLQRVELRVPPERAPGKLTIRVETPGGEIYERGVGGHDTDPRVFVESASGRRLADSVVVGRPGRSSLKAGEWTPELPVGRYRVRVRPGLDLGCVVSHPSKRWPYPEKVVEAEVLPGADTRVVVALEPGGHVDFLSSGRDTRDSWTLLQSFMEPPGSRSIRDAVGRDNLGGCDVVLIDARGGVLDGLAFDLLGSNGHAVQETSWVVPGFASRGLGAVAPGVYTLRVSRSGRTILEREVAVRAGEVTEVAW